MYRGLLIVFEGLDRSGKTTQINLLKRKMVRDKERVLSYNFPNRSSQSGKIIHDYLTFRKDLTPEAAHLLFAFNIWESQQEIQIYLESGYTVLIDRYCFSTTAYSIARGVSKDLCDQTMNGLLKPDYVFFMEVDPETAAKRLAYGLERTENISLQVKVRNAYQRFMSDFYIFSQEREPYEISNVIHTLYLDKTLKHQNKIEFFYSVSI